MNKNTLTEIVADMATMSDAHMLEFVRWMEDGRRSALFTEHPDIKRRWEQARKDFLAKKKIEYYKITKVLREELLAVGVTVTSIYDLINSQDRYDVALPVLLLHVNKAYPDVIREGLMRSFGRPWARDLAWDAVLKAYLGEPNKSGIAPAGEVGAPSGPKDGMAVALAEMAKPSDLKTLIDLIREPKNGPSRIFFVKNLSRSRSAEAFDVLAKLSADPELEQEIAHRLKSKMRRQAKIEGRNGAKQ